MRDLRPELHEMGHSVIASAMGCKTGAVEVRGECGRSFFKSRRYPAAVLDGLDIEQPFVTWPAGVRDRFTADALVALAGDIGENELAPKVGRVAEPVAVQALELVTAELPVSPGERARLAESFDSGSAKTDEEALAEIVTLMFGDDWRGGATWVAFLTEQCRAMVLHYEDRIRRLAGILAETGSMSGFAVAALINEEAVNAEP